MHQYDHRRLTALALTAMIFFAAAPVSWAAPANDIAQQIADKLAQLSGNQPGVRLLHAKGVVCEGTFTPAKTAASLSSAAFLNGPTLPITVRFSDGAGLPDIPDSSPQAVPRGMAIRFLVNDDGATDIVVSSRNGFQAATPQDLLDFLVAATTTTPTSPHPNPFETFMGAHPRIAKILMTPIPLEPSFAGVTFYGNNAFAFTNKDGRKQYGRYRIVPITRIPPVAAAAAAKWPPNILFDDIRSRVAQGPVKFRLMVQLAAPSDTVDDSSQVWPDMRIQVELGEIDITRVYPPAESDKLQRGLAFDPGNLPAQGIAFSDDPLLPLRSQVYALSVARRNK